MVLSPVIDKFIDKIIEMLQDDTLKKKIEILILQPFIQYFIELVFPYVIIICVVFGILILMLASILCILILRLPHLFGDSSVS
jgi:uncharacterized membrane protein